MHENRHGPLLRKRLPLDLPLHLPGLSLDVDVAVTNADRLFGQPDHPFDVSPVRRFGPTKDNDLPTPRLTQPKNRFVHYNPVTGQDGLVLQVVVGVATQRANGLGHQPGRVGLAGKPVPALIALHLVVRPQQRRGHRTAGDPQRHQQALDVPRPHHEHSDHDKRASFRQEPQTAV